MKEIKNLKEFKRMMRSGKIVLLNFYASWCRPCSTNSPIIEKLAVRHHGDFEIAKVNVDDHKKLVQDFGVRNIPALFFMKDGEVIEYLSGVQNETELETKIQKHKSENLIFDYSHPSDCFWSLIF